MCGNRSNRNKTNEKREEKSKFGTNYIPNDLGGGQQSKQRYPDLTSYCRSCEYDIKPTHTPVSCTNCKHFYNKAATIDNCMGGVSTNCHFYTAADELWCGKVDSRKISQNKINKTDLNKYTPSSSNSTHLSYAAVVINTYSNCMSRLLILTSKFKEIINDKNIPQGHPDLAATSIFLANKHKYLGKELQHEETKVGVANTNTMNSVTTRQL